MNRHKSISLISVLAMLAVGMACVSSIQAMVFRSDKVDGCQEFASDGRPMEQPLGRTGLPVVAS